MADAPDLGALAAARVDITTNISQFISDLSAAKAKLSDLQNASKPAESSLSKIFSSVKSDVGGFVSDITSAKTAITAFIAVLGIREGWDILKAGLQTASDIKTLGQQSDLTSQQIQGLQYAGVKAGVSIEDINQGVLTFNRTLGDFLQNQSGPGAKAFQTLGIAAGLAKGNFASTGDVLTAVLQKLSKVQDSATQAAYASELFGRELGPRLVPIIQQSGGSLDALVKSAQAAGFALSDNLIDEATKANETLDTLFALIERQGITALAKFAPQIQGIADQIVDSLPSLVLWVEKWADYFNLIKESPLDKLKQQIQDTTDDISSLQGDKKDQGWWWKIFGLSDDDINALIAADRTKIAKLQKQIDSVDWAPGGHPFVLGSDAPPVVPKPLKLGKPDAQAAAADDTKAKLQALADEEVGESGLITTALAKASADQIKQADATNAALLKGKQGYYQALLQGAQDDAAAQIALIDAEEKQQLAKLDEIETKAKALGQPWQQYEDLKTQISQAATDKREAIASQEVERLKEISDEARGALGQLSDQAKGPLDQALNTVAATGLGNFGDQLADVVTGSEKVSDAISNMVKSIISDLIKLAAQRYIEGPIADMLLGPNPTANVSAGTSGGTGSAASLATGLANTIGKSSGIYTDLTNWFGGFLADGGSVSPGSGYIVGEQGPELFVPGSAGQIIPNGDLAGATGGMSRGGGSVVVNIQTPNPAAFQKSQSQISAMLTRAVAQGQRNL